MYSFSYLEPFSCSISRSNCCFLTCIEISQESGQVVWYSHLFQNFPVSCDTHSQRFVIVNKTEIDIFMELSCFFHDPADVGNFISDSSAFSITSLNIWKFKIHTLLEPALENFKKYLTGMWDEWYCVVVWAFFGIAVLGFWSENWPFRVLWPLLSFPNYLAYWVQNFHCIVFPDLKKLTWNAITSTSFVRRDAF